MAPTLTSAVVYRLFFLAALFFRPARAELYITGSPAGIAVGIIFLLIVVGGGAAACFFLARRKRASPQVFVPQKPLPQDQVPMLAPPQNPFTDAASPGPPPTAANPYPYAQNTEYHQNTSGYVPNAAAGSSQYPGQYPHAASSNQNAFAPPLGPPPV